MSTEQWRPIPGWDGYYEVSDHGRVRSVERVIVRKNGTTQRWKPRIRKDGPHGSQGHRGVTLWKDGQLTMRTVHSLVLEAFVGLRPEGMHACHGDGDPTNNRLDNLRWDTPSANQWDKVGHGKHHNGNKTHCKRGHAFDEKNTIIRGNGRGRHCRACRSESNREAKARRRAQQKEVAA